MRETKKAMGESCALIKPCFVCFHFSLANINIFPRTSVTSSIVGFDDIPKYNMAKCTNCDSGRCKLFNICVQHMLYHHVFEDLVWFEITH